MPTEITLLTGSQLEAWLDEIGKFVEQQSYEDLSEELQRENLLSMLQQYRYQVDTTDSIYRLYNFWLMAGDTNEAMSAIENGGGELLKTLEGDEFKNTQVSLSLWRAEVLETSDPSQLVEALEVVEKVANDSPQHQQRDDLWSHLAYRAEAAGAYDLERRCAEKLFEIKQSDPDRKSFRAWDSALLSAQHAQSFNQQGKPEQAVKASDEAIKKLAEATADQDVDYDDWLKLGNMLAQASPMAYEAVAQNTRALLSRDNASKAISREVEVSLARVEAQSFHAQGKIKEAIAKGKQGHFDLRRDDDDSFGAILLNWYKEAGQLDEAAKLAFESAYCSRPVSSELAYQMALENVESGEHKNAYWPLLLAYACMDENLQDMLEEQATSTFTKDQYEHYLEQAKQWDANHPMINLLQAEKFYKAKQYEKALALLEDIAKNPEYENVFHGDLGEALWIARIKVHGIEEALLLPLFNLESAGWNYGLGVDLNDLEEVVAPNGESWPEKEVEKLATRYYERGLARYERFFEEGTGGYRNGDIHSYSMLCNNLAIDYAFDQDRFEDAIELHKKGIAASPFAEHYSGIMSRQKKLEDWEGYISAAEDLWQFAEKHGYSRHTPEDYIDDVTNVLVDELDRPRECSMWLQRLTEWWDQLDEDEKSERDDDYWSTLAIVLRNVGETQPDDALALMEVALPNIVAQKKTCETRLAAYFYEQLDHPDKALPLYEEAIVNVRPNNSYDESQAELARDSIKDCQKSLNPKAWWKVW